MPRRLLIVLLAAGTLGGYASGFASLAHRNRACHWGASGSPWEGPAPRAPQPAPAAANPPPPSAASSGPVIVSVTAPPAFASLPVAATPMPGLTPSAQALYVATPTGLQPVVIATAAGPQPVYVASAPVPAGVTGFALSSGNMVTLDASPAVRPAPTLALPASVGSAPAATAGAR
ncbi:hypothetical protein JGU66_13435 [Myxococcaceae bacterium JPH2]|nr:hypothetical protein [Myxococcaceae bacterium JPH2]